MKDLNELFYLVALLFLTIACQSNKDIKKEENSPIVISVKELSTEPIVKASAYFKSATVIPLETSDSCLLVSLKKALPYDNKLYVLDSRNDAGIFCFDMKGKLLKIIGSKGTGPHEHASLKDFCLDEKNGWIYLNDRNRNRILIFTVEGEYVKSIPVDDYYDKIELFGKNLYMAENKEKNDSHDLAVKNLEGKTIAKYFPSLEEKIQPVPWFIKTDQGVYYYPNRLQDSIYSVFDNGSELYLYVDFGKHAIKRAEWEKITDVAYESTHPIWQTMLQNDYIGGFSSAFIFDKLIVVGFTYQMNGNWMIFYEKPTEKTSVVCSFIDDLSYLGFNNMISQTDSQFICAKEEPDLERLITSIQEFWIQQKYVTPEEAEKGIARLKALQNQVLEDANPIVVIYDLK